MKIIKYRHFVVQIFGHPKKKLIQMRLDLEEMEQFPTNKIEGFENE
jgi:cyanophycin synthetase